MDMWVVVNQVVGLRYLSDHCTIWLKVNVLNRGPRSFRDLDCWFDNKEFMYFVRNSDALEVYGRSDFVIKEKLKLLKVCLKKWNVKVFGRLDMEVEDRVERINRADASLVGCESGVIKDLVANRKLLSSEFWKKLYMKENLLIQKSRLKWLTNGDCNSKLCHVVVKNRNCRKFIGSFINSEGRCVEGVKQVNEGIQSHFKKHFQNLIFIDLH